MSSANHPCSSVWPFYKRPHPRQQRLLFPQQGSKKRGTQAEQKQRRGKAKAWTIPPQGRAESPNPDRPTCGRFVPRAQKAQHKCKGLFKADGKLSQIKDHSTSNLKSTRKCQLQASARIATASIMLPNAGESSKSQRVKSSKLLLRLKCSFLSMPFYNKGRKRQLQTAHFPQKPHLPTMQALSRRFNLQGTSVRKWQEKSVIRLCIHLHLQFEQALLSFWLPSLGQWQTSVATAIQILSLQAHLWRFLFWSLFSKHLQPTCGLHCIYTLHPCIAAILMGLARWM